jgi:DNA-directed RNA polymerase specialized sigma subunit
VGKRKKKEEGYLSNQEMFKEVLKCQSNDQISDSLGKMFMIMSRRIATKPNFSGYSYKDEMIGNGVVACCAALHKFDPEKSENTFAYYTSIIHNAFIQILNKEKKQHDIRDALLVSQNMTPSFGFSERHKAIDPYDRTIAEQERESNEDYEESLEDFRDL